MISPESFHPKVTTCGDMANSDAWNGLKECLRQSGTILPVKKTEQALILSTDGKTSVLLLLTDMMFFSALLNVGYGGSKTKIGSVRKRRGIYYRYAKHS